MTREEALKKMQAFIDFFPAAKTEIEEIIDALSNPIWHESDKVPHKDTPILIETSFFGDSLEYYSYCWCSPPFSGLEEYVKDNSYYKCSSSFPSWKEYVKEYHVKRWAYIDELFSK